MEISFKRDAAHNYMIPQTEEQFEESDYQIRMIMENHVRGLLPCSLKSWNGKVSCYFDITSKQAMKMIYEKEKMKETDIRKLLVGLYTALTSAKQYLLDMDHLVLEPEMIYMDIETREPLFCFLPSYREHGIHLSFAKLTTFILQHLDQSDDAGVLLGFEIYRKAMENNYSLENLLKQTVHEEQDRKHENEQTATMEKAADMEVHRVPLTPVFSQADSMPMSKAAECRERPGRKKSHHKTAHEEGKSNRIFAAAAILCIAGGTAAVSWLAGLNTTQIGGIVFLCSGLTGYLISMKKKQQKTPQERVRAEEKKADKRSRKNMKRIEKARQTMRQSTQQQTIQQQAIQQQVIQQQAIQQQTIQQQNVQQQNVQQQTIQQQELQMGATILLDEGEEEYQPRLSLISMNPGERNSIILLKDKYVIGKMKSKCDVVIDHPAISRIHASIEKIGDRYYLQDMNSTNGTFVNGKRLAVNECAAVQLTDEIRFAEFGYYVGRC